MISIENNPNIEGINNKVLKIPDGTLFLWQKNSGQGQFEYLVGNKALSLKSINNFKYNITENNKYCKRMGIPYQHIIFPCKPVAYKKRLEELGLCIEPIVNEEILTLENVYYPQLSDLREDYYLKTDSHCSPKGFLFFIKAILKIMGVGVVEDNFIWKYVDHIGDLANMIGLKHPIKKYQIQFPNSLDKHSFSIRHILPGNTGDVSIHINFTAQNKSRVLLFGDSFLKGCINILSHYFSEIFFMRSCYINKDVSNCLAPDIIITSNAERYLVDVPSIDTGKPFFINFFNNKIDFTKLSENNINAFHSFFSPRDSNAYIKWINRLKLISMLQNKDINNIDELILNEQDIDYIRNQAIINEKIDLKFSYDLMLIAHKSRPNGPFIKAKLNEYNSLLNFPNISLSGIKLREIVKEGKVAIIPIGFRSFTKQEIHKLLAISQPSLPFDSGYFPPISVASVINDPFINMDNLDKSSQAVCIKYENHYDPALGLGIKFQKSSYEEIDFLAASKDSKCINKYLDSSLGYYTLDLKHNFILSQYNWHKYYDPKKSKGCADPLVNLKNINQTLNRRIERMFDMCESSEYILFIYQRPENYNYMSIGDRCFDLHDLTPINMAVKEKFNAQSFVITLDEFNNAENLLQLMQ